MNSDTFKILFSGLMGWPVRFSGRVVLAGVFLACISVPAWGRQPAPPSLADLEVPGFKWNTQQTMQLSGVPMHVKHFTSRMAADPAAQVLALHSGLFERVLKLNTKVVLSGMQSGWHWLAEVNTFESGSRGYVSALLVGAAGTLGSPHDAAPHFSWLPPQAKRQFDHHNTVGGRSIVQQVYSVALPMQTLTSYVRKQLRTQGWMPEPELASVGAGMTWGKAGSRLMLLAQQGAAGSSLYVHYIE